MSARSLRSPFALAAGLALLTAGCDMQVNSPFERQPAAAAPAPVPAPGPPQTASATPQRASAGPQRSEMNTSATIFTVLGLADEEPETPNGPQFGAKVSPTLWQAVHDVLNFVAVGAEDPLTGVIVTDWYSPPQKANERMRISVYILSRALRSDSISITIEREERGSSGGWTPSTVARDVVENLENTILMRARHLRAERAMERAAGKR